MTRNNEALSCLADDELDREGSAFIIRRLAEDEQTQQTWQRFHLMGACMRGEFTGPVSLVSRVRDALESEAPPVRHRSTMSAVMRFGMGGALAAGFAVFAVVGLGNRMASDSMPGSDAAQTPGFVSQSTALDRQFSRQVVPTGFNPASSDGVDRSGPAASFDRDSRQRINRYLIRHGQAAGSGGFISFAPVLTAPASARIVRSEDYLQAERAQRLPPASESESGQN
ncbi:MAG: sigma-E factor negative regulatory protein [Wenzhouxiangellaceae bacterium]|nr:sigma-E factor negative regulatory protein [Wenzhouxiangellaceae bacterium]